jgi:hypothetical protein
MFRIGLLEAGITCAIVALAIIIPLMIGRLNTRLKDIENKLEKKK